jgi:hypothetical protein
VCIEFITFSDLSSVQIPLSGEPQNEKPLYEAFRFIEDADLFLALGAKLVRKFKN